MVFSYQRLAKNEFSTPKASKFDRRNKLQCLCLCVCILLGCILAIVIVFVVLPASEPEYDFAEVPRNDTAFNIRMVISPNISVNHYAGIYRAVTRWQKIINGSLPAPETVSRKRLLEKCNIHINETEMVIDDIVIFIRTKEIDGPWGTVGSASWCVLDNNNMPRVGFIIIDSDDIDRYARLRLMEALMVHEIGHSLGIGTIWEIKNSQGKYIRQWVTPETKSTPWFFERPNAQLAESELTENPLGPFPQVEDVGGDGSARCHWKYEKYPGEVMTQGMHYGKPVVSILTIRSLADLGYEVDVTQADKLVLEKQKRRLRQERLFECAH